MTNRPGNHRPASGMGIRRIVGGRLAQCRRWSSCVLLASVALAGCATKPLSHQLLVTADTADARLATFPRIIADSQPAELSSFEMTPEEWTKFEEQRSANIRAAASREAKAAAAGSALAVLPYCTVPFFCPFAVGIGVVTTGIATGYAAARADMQNRWFIPPEDGSRFSANFKKLATSDSLAARTARLVESEAIIPAVNAEGYPRLVIRFQSAQLWYPSANNVGIIMTARAQAFSSAEASWTPTHHKLQLPAQPLAEWTAGDDELVRQRIDEGLDALARSIISTYLPR